MQRIYYYSFLSLSQCILHTFSDFQLSTRHIPTQPSLFRTTLALPLYYTGITASRGNANATVWVEGGRPRVLPLGHNDTIALDVDLEPRAITWYLSSCNVCCSSYFFTKAKHRMTWSSKCCLNRFVVTEDASLWLLDLSILLSGWFVATINIYVLLCTVYWTVDQRIATCDLWIRIIWQHILYNTQHITTRI